MALGHASRVWIAVGVLAVGTLVEPAVLDQVRLPLTLVVSWPGRRLTAGWRAAPEPPPDLTAARREVLQAEADAGEAVILWERPGRDVLVIAQGFRHGVRRGDLVSAGGAFLGVVDQTSAHLARVRLATHQSCTYAASITGDDPLRLLLRGSMDGTASGQRGILIPSELAGREVVTADEERAREPLLIGHVRFEAADAEPVIALAGDPRAADTVRVHGRGPLLTPISAAELYEPVPGEVLLDRDACPGVESWLLSAGKQKGVRLGAYVSFRGRLVGRVSRLGFWSCRVAPARFPPGSAAVAWGEEGGLVRGRSLTAELPRGLAVVDGAGPVRGDEVRVHVFRHPDELRDVTGRTRR